MQTHTLWPLAATRTLLAGLTRLTIAALIGLALALVYAQALLLGAFLPDLTVFATLMLLAAALLTTGWRWTPIVGALLSAMVVAGNSKRGLLRYHPPSGVSLLRLYDRRRGAGADWHRRRDWRDRAELPRCRASCTTWDCGCPATLAGLMVGALVVGALPQPASAGVSPEVLAQLPAITTPEMHFDKSEMTAKVDQLVALRFDNTHVAPHSFDIDDLNVHVPVASGKQGVILFTPTQPGSYTFYCGVPGHREAGMVGTLIVEP